MLSYFRVENYKCLERVEFPITPIHVIIGPNDSGKTSLLEAMLAYMRSTSLPISVQKALPEGWQGNELIYHGAQSDGQISLTALSDRSLAPKDAVAGIGPRWDLLGYGFSLAFRPQGIYQVASEWTITRRIRDQSKPSGEPDESKMMMADNAEKNLEYTTPAHLRSHGKDPEVYLKLPHGMFGPAVLYRFDPKVLALPAEQNVDRKFRLDPDGFGLATLLDDILGHDPDAFLALRKAFCEFFTEFKTMRLETASAYHREYDHEQGVHWTRRGGPGKEILFDTKWGGIVRARQASEGVLLFLTVLALTYLPAPKRPTLLLLEEPEKGVYPKKLEELIQCLKKCVEASGENVPQIIMATHSPYVISFFNPEQVTFLTRARSGGVQARPLREAPRIQERLAEGFYLGELWYNLSEEDLFGGTLP